MRGNMRAFNAALVAFLSTSLALLSQSPAEKIEHHATMRRVLSSSSSDSDTDMAVTGLQFSPVASRSVGIETTSSSMEEEIIEALEIDNQVTVVGDIQVATLDCDSLEGTEDATTLLVATSFLEMITVNRTSYTYLSGELFDDSLARNVWVGEEIVKNTMNPRRTISVTWGEICDVETFLLQVTTTEQDADALSVIKSIPCVLGAATDMCVVETEVIPNEEDQPDPTEAPFDRFRARGLGETRRLRPAVAKSVTSVKGAPREKRQLQSTTTIDVMYLYTELAMETLGGVSDTQMQTTIATALVTTNEAMTNSEIDLEISPVHIGSLPYNDNSTSTTTVLETLAANDDVAEMRDIYEADLVQLYSFFGIDGGRGYLYTGNDTKAFSVVNALSTVVYSHSHEMAHNLGCYHNRENSDAKTDYAHGYRYCNGTDPYRTIMSRLCPDDLNVKRINFFSNPDVEELNKPTGTDDNNCARAIKENMETVSKFRPLVDVTEEVNPCLNNTSSEYKCTGKNNRKTIDLNRCGLTDADASLLRACFEVVDITAITKIKLNVNSFTSLPYDLFDGIDSLATLNLNRNCDLTCMPPVPSSALRAYPYPNHYDPASSGTNVYLSSCNSDIDTCEA